MKRESLLILLGVLVAISPFAGVPLSWLLWILPILGILVIIIGISLRHDRREQEAPVPHEAFPTQTLTQ